MKVRESPYINRRKKTIEFYVHHLNAAACRHISLAGSFNHWATNELQMQVEKDNGGCWKISIPMLPHGKYYYRFLIDDKMWMEDIENPLREPDGTVGWNSVLTI
jgi:1,4-alpha-glucan branching enzyme